MPTNLKSIGMCLIMIQALAILGCKNGGGSGNSSLRRLAVKPINIPAGQLAKQGEKLTKGFDGELSADSYTVEADGKKQERSKSRCGFKIVESNNEHSIEITLGDYSTKLPITKTMYEENFKKVASLEKAVQTKSVDAKNQTLTFATIQSTTHKSKRALSYDQARFVFSETNLDLKNLKDEELEKYRQILIKESDATDVSYFRDTFKFITNGQSFSGIDYTNSRYVNGSAAKKKANKIEEGEFKIEAVLNCQFHEERNDKTSEPLNSNR